ncbi:MAG: endonuclease [Flavisolibacter sp.]|nr:endonuclease [Flavisolibacter sp.]
MVYLIHLSEKLHHAQHYIGYCNEGTLQQRLYHHRNGTGARFMQVVTELGIPWQVARVWEKGDRNFERKLKNRKKARCLCPCCRPQLQHHN